MRNIHQSASYILSTQYVLTAIIIIVVVVIIIQSSEQRLLKTPFNKHEQRPGGRKIPVHPGPRLCGAEGTCKDVTE